MKDRLVVLIVEDDSNVMGTLMLFVESISSVEMLTASDFADAATLIAQTPRIDLLLCDVMLPGAKSGIDLAQAAVDAHPRIAVLLMSAESEGDIVGITDRFSFLRKPFGVESLTKHIDAAFERLRPH
jgi:response regulator of citrate/malate metabolism